MTTITKITRTEAQQIGADALAALEAVAAQYGITVSQKRGTYNANNFKVGFEFAVKDSSGAAKTPGRVDLERSFPQYVDAKVRLHSGEIGTVTEYHYKKRKYPFIVVAPSGTYKLTDTQVRYGIVKKAA